MKVTRRTVLAMLAATALGGGGLAAGVTSAQATAPDPVRSTDPDAIHAQHQKDHPLTPAEIADRRAHLQTRDGGQGKVVGTRKATTRDVASGFAATLASTVYICSSGANLKDPVTNTLSRDTWIGVGWDESADSNGSPDARIHSGSAPLVVHNDKTTTIYWSAAQWENAGGLLYQWTRWYYNQTVLNSVSPNGGILAMGVQADGNATPQGNVWYNQEHHAFGFETYVAYTQTSAPVVDAFLWGSGSNASKYSHTEVWIEATNSSPCGVLASSIV